LDDYSVIEIIDSNTLSYYNIF